MARARPVWPVCWGLRAFTTSATFRAAFLADDVAAFTPDVMIVDMALPDRDTLEGLRQSSGRAPRPAVLFADDPALAAEAIAAGVHAYHFDETGAQEIKPILIAAIALFRHRPKSADPE